MSDTPTDESEDTTASDQRISIAVYLLREAIRFESFRFASDALRVRLERRPTFMADTSARALVQMRRSLMDETQEHLGEVGPALRDLRIFYATTPSSIEDERAALTRLLGKIEDITKRILLTLGVPGDDKSDDGSKALDMSPSYDLAFELPDSVFWAWQQVRNIDDAIAAVEAGNLASFNVQFLLPEALAETKLDS